MNVSQHTVRTVLTKWQMKESRGHSDLHDPDDGFGNQSGGAFRVVPPHNDPVEELPTLAEGLPGGVVHAEVGHAELLAANLPTAVMLFSNNSLLR